MNLKEIFNYEYIEIESNDDNAIKFFLDEENEIEKRYKKPLKLVFMHKNLNEMYLILDFTKFTFKQIKESFIEWENIVLSYVNFGEEFLDNKKFLKYNIVLTMLCIDFSQNEDDIFRYEIEKSKNICRKIFILVDKNGEVLDSNKTMLPFYFKDIEDLKNSIEEEYENKLKNILPQDKKLKMILEKKTGLEMEDEKLILGWLNNGK